MLNTPFSPWPSFSAEEIAAVQAVLASNRVNYWTGVEGREFEKEFSTWCGAKHSVALANGTVALELALKALGIGPGDEVIVTPRSFIASVSCVVSMGATPIFADVDRDSGNLTAETIKRALSPRTKAVVLVHLAGWPCDMDPILQLAKAHNFKVVEDCAQAHGARYKGRSVGVLGHVGAWSFCQDKIITTGGEGGMITTNDSEVYEKIWSLKDHGKSLALAHSPKKKAGFQWLHDSFGGNGRMMEFQAAIGRHQLRYLARWGGARQSNAQRIQEACREHSALRVPPFRCNRRTCAVDCPSSSGCKHAHYKCYVYVESSRLLKGWDRDRVIAEINSRGVPCYHGACPEIYQEKAFDNTGWRPAERLPVAKELGETSLMFLVHPTLTDEEVTKTCDAVNAVLRVASRD
jgi:dTDP-4-amino-4,6-dideoxygalactose transaminase